MECAAGERRRRAAIARYWRAVELFSPPKVDPVNAEKNMYPVEAGRPLPWEPGHAVADRRPRRGWVWQHTVYAGIFDIERMRAVLADVFGADDRDQDFDGRQPGHSALLSFTVDQDGLLLMDSPMLSSCAWAVGRALSPGPADPGWLDGFEEDSEQCLGRLTQLADGRLAAVTASSQAGGVGRGALGAIAGVAANVVLGAATGGLGVLGAAASTALGSVWGPVAAGAIQKSGEGVAETAVGAAKDAALRRAGVDPQDAESDSAADPGQPPPALLGEVPLEVRGMAAVVRWVAAELGVADALLPDAIRVKSHQVRASRAEEADQQGFLNSFVAEDLARVAQSLAAGTSGRALEEYLRSGSSLDRSARTDVRREPAALLAGVRPSAAPLGRWPANPRHPLVLSQQFAVNTALAELGAEDARGVYAVNGPPGTGKTTMLRDFVAALVVRRAERLAGLRRARDAFGPPQTWTADGHERSIHPPVPELTGFEMVVASANNGAVENVTTEIPAVDAVHEGWRAAADYLSQPASLLLGAPAWGAVAARLGNRGNRTEFRERFWWGEEKPLRVPGQRSGGTRSGRGLHDLLRQAEELRRADRAPDGPRSAPPLGACTWAEACRRFTTARDAVRLLAAERDKAAEALGRRARIASRLLAARAAADTARQSAATADETLGARQSAAHDSEEALSGAQATLHSARAVLDQARRDAALARDLCAAAATELTAFDRTGPGWWRRTFSPRSVERWRHERRSYAEAVRSREAAWREADDRARQALEHVAAGEAQAEAARARLDEARGAVTEQQRLVRRAQRAVAAADSGVRRESQTQRADQRLVAGARRGWGTSVPGAEWDAPAEDDRAAEIRELSAPWMDEEFARARSELFLAALDLHRALLAAEPELVRRSMLSAMEVIGGGAPKDLGPRQVLAAWQLLFLIVPVVSTTFASLGRMFAGLGAESLGWLFVDEAGQAAPQQVVGALWRARRAVVVGDPLQLEPVVTLPWTGQQSLREHFGVAEEWAPARTSVQRLSDRLARYGTALPGPDGEAVWVGSPLRVHRRCDRLMFDVSNAIAYDGMMVFGTGVREAYPTVNRSIWLHVEGSGDGKWIPREGQVLTRCLDLIAGRLRGALLDERAAAAAGTAREWDGPRGDEDPLEAELRRRLAQAVFVVSPFRDVVRGAQQIADPLLPRSHRRVGTVHTTQGKEADVVILVLGTEPDQHGSREWATQTPNLLNVAVSRARRRLIVIGNHDAWSGHRYVSTLANHPDLHLKDAGEWLGG